MRVPFRIALAVTLVILSTFIGHASAAAVMSIDLGTEWMKVLSIGVVSRDFLTLSLFLGWHRVSGHADGDCTEQGVEEENTVGDCFS